MMEKGCQAFYAGETSIRPRKRPRFIRFRRNLRDPLRSADCEDGRTTACRTLLSIRVDEELTATRRRHGGRSLWRGRIERRSSLVHPTSTLLEASLPPPVESTTIDLLGWPG